jgi:hypothetical protein
MIKNIKWLLLVSLSFVACNNDDEVVTDVPVTAGSADFSKYVALGDSFAAGFSDGALFIKGQENSYPNILAGQFAQAGGGAFTTPLMADNTGGLLFGGGLFPLDPSQFTPRLVLKGFLNPTTPNIGLVTPQGSQTTEATTVLAGPFSNLGVPGAKSFHLLAAGYGSSAGNPYFRRFASAPSTTVLADALTQAPSFFSLWIGGNDLLSFAMSGGTGVNNNISGNTTPSTYGSNDITHNAVFDATINGLASQLATGGRKGVLANLPYITTLPFFTTVGYNPAPLNAAQVSALNSGYAPYNGGLQIAKNMGLITEEERLARTITFVEGKNAVVIMDEYLTDITVLSPSLVKMRQTTKSDYILLSSGGVPAQAHLAAGNGTAAPLQDKWVVSKKEVEEIVAATTAYNISIKAAADANGLAFVDAKAIMDQLVNGGVRFGNYHMAASFLTGGAFSLDGIHPGARGYALIANKFAEAINAKYGSTLRSVDLGNYQIQYPASL